MTDQPDHSPENDAGWTRRAALTGLSILALGGLAERGWTRNFTNHVPDPQLRALSLDVTGTETARRLGAAACPGQDPAAIEAALIARVGAGHCDVAGLRAAGLRDLAQGDTRTVLGWHLTQSEALLLGLGAGLRAAAAT